MQAPLKADASKLKDKSLVEGRILLAVQRRATPHTPLGRGSRLGLARERGCRGPAVLLSLIHI